MRIRNTILGILTIALLFFFVKFFCEITYFLFPSTDDRAGELVKLLFTIIGGFCLLFGLYISNRRAKATEESVKTQWEQINLALKSQIDERFKNAIEHLGSDKEPIILGGIAELHQIGKEDSRKYAEVVFNILCSYIRTETSIYKKTAKDINVTVIDTIISYLFSKKQDNMYRIFSADLRSSNLANQDLSNCDFSDANLGFCHLGSIDHSILKNVNLSKAEIFAISFKNNSLTGAKLFQTKIIHTTIKDAAFTEVASLVQSFGAICLNCKFENVSFDNLSIFGSFFIGCTFKNCTFYKSQIMRTCFYGCRLNSISFSDLNILSNVDFSASTFFNVNISSFGSHLIFKGCSIDRHGDGYISSIEKQLAQQKDKELQAVDLKISNLSVKGCTFGTLTDVECEAIVKKYKEFDTYPQFPLGKSE